MKELILPAERRAVVFPPIPCMVEAPSRSEVEAEEKACEAKAKAVEEAKARAETLKEKKAEELSQLQSALVTSRHALKAMKAVDMRWKCEE